MTFVKGQSGNPKGRPRGKRDCATEIRELLDEAAPSIVAMTLDAARAGDSTAMRALLDKIIPNARPERRPVNVPILGNSLADKARHVMQLVSSGELSTDHADDLLSSLATLTQIIETTELQERLDRLEARYAEQESASYPAH